MLMARSPVSVWRAWRATDLAADPRPRCIFLGMSACGPSRHFVAMPIRSLSERSGHSASRAYRTGFMSTQHGERERHQPHHSLSLRCGDSGIALGAVKNVHRDDADDHGDDQGEQQHFSSFRNTRARRWQTPGAGSNTGELRPTARWFSIPLRACLRRSRTSRSDALCAV
jgi:hypothetical protein